ncbi:MAG: CDGSH iron-sulfur domain-containing protein [Bacteroidales bacterium]|jgi:CDGSH-type Zn-finger protein
MMDKDQKSKSQAIIEVIDSGPLKITGNFILRDLQRDKETKACEVLLCRCGKSSDKPFCDGSHRNK